MLYLLIATGADNTHIRRCFGAAGGTAERGSLTTPSKPRIEMKTSELKPGRTFAAVFEHGDDFMSSLAGFCRDNGVRQGYIPMFPGRVCRG